VRNRGLLRGGRTHHLATDNELLRNILLAIMSSLAKVEAQKIGERTRAGMARAKAQGKHIGRPALDPTLQRKIAGRRTECLRGGQGTWD
jgi:DNA invertase Pin-like site-specific DNA recombinase